MLFPSGGNRGVDERLLPLAERVPPVRVVAVVQQDLRIGVDALAALGLRCEQLANVGDFAAAVIRVRHSIEEVTVDGTNRIVLAELKTERSRRTLQLPGKVAEALRALRTVQAADKLRLGPHYGGMNLVFCSSAGMPLSRQKANYHFKKACAAAGLGSGWHPHEHRHTFVSVLSDAGIDIEQIADSVGHVNSSVTREVYRHQIADKVTRASAAMDQIFGTGSA